MRLGTTTRFLPSSIPSKAVKRAPSLALTLALARRLPGARDNQQKRVWRGMIGDLSAREDELGGKTLLIVGLGDIGGRLARLAKAFEIRVIGLRRNPGKGAGGSRPDR